MFRRNIFSLSHHWNTTWCRKHILKRFQLPYCKNAVKFYSDDKNAEEFSQVKPVHTTIDKVADKWDQRTDSDRASDLSRIKYKELSQSRLPVNEIEHNHNRKPYRKENLKYQISNKQESGTGKSRETVDYRDRTWCDSDKTKRPQENKRHDDPSEKWNKKNTHISTYKFKENDDKWNKKHTAKSTFYRPDAKFPRQQGDSAEAHEFHQKHSKNNKWCDTFGTLSSEGDEVSTIADNEKHMADLENERTATNFYHHVPLARYNRRHEPVWYARRIQQFGKKGKVKEAIQVFEEWMIKEDRVRPSGYEYFVLIDLLAQVGYTRKAFKLFNQMVRAGIYVEDPMYTVMFNACANCPFPQMGLQYAKKLQTRMLLQGVQPNYITFNAMIKAFAMLGDINMAFCLADEAAKLNVTDNLLSSLLMACISDKEAGFRHAVLVWRKFNRMGIKPSVRDYNLLLRCVRECGIGDKNSLNNILGLGDRNTYLIANNTLMPHATVCDMYVESKQENGDMLSGILLASKCKNDDVLDFDKSTDKPTYKLSHVKQMAMNTQIDELISKFEDVHDAVASSSEVKDDSDSCENWAVHVEGAEVPISSEKGIVAMPDTKKWWEMDIFQVTSKKHGSVVENINPASIPNILDPDKELSPAIHLDDIKTESDRFALLGGLNQFLRNLEKENIKPDIKTYTQLISVVPSYCEDRLLDEMEMAGCKADITFYNHLIMKRFKTNRARDIWSVLDRIKRHELKPNLQTYAGLSLACVQRNQGLKLIDDILDAGLMPNSFIMGSLLKAAYTNLPYKSDVMRKMEELGIRPTKYIIAETEKHLKKCKERIDLKDSGIDVMHASGPQLRNTIDMFMDFYEKWLKRNLIEEEEHPWKAFKPKKMSNTLDN